MARNIPGWQDLAFVAVLGISVAACGGGEIVGIGNSGNRLALGGTAEQVAEALSAHPETPRVTDDVLAEIYAAILGHATRGDPEAALIVLRVAEQQRRADEE